MAQPHRYVIALGSNVRHARHGLPPQVLAAALRTIGETGDVAIEAVAPVLASAPLGPSRRRYANTAAVIQTRRDPAPLLALLKQIEQEFGRRTSGQRWGRRVLDLDIVLWSGGAHASPELVIPHPAFRERAFVLGPVASIAPRWRDPVSGLATKQLLGRLTRRSRLPKRAAGGTGP